MRNATHSRTNKRIIARIQGVSFGINTLEDLQEHLQVAIELEHSTIPTYLCALYSLQDGHNAAAAAVIKSVVIEEMLHLTLAANVLNAIGGEPSLNRPEFIPTYPTTLPHSDGHIWVNLEKFSPDALRTFMKVEKPAPPSAKPEADKYHSIGQFYAAIEDGLKRLSRQSNIFTGDPARQVTPNYFYGSGGKVVPVTDLDSSLLALEEIVDQGEGIDHTIFDSDHKLFGQKKELAHYFRFNQIHAERYYTKGDTTRSQPSGAPFPVDWDTVYPMRRNPKTKNYPEGSELWEMSNEFNRTYTNLLNLMHRSFNGEPSLLIDSVGAMYDLKYKAVALMKIPCGKGNQTAGPSFEYVPA